MPNNTIAQRVAAGKLLPPTTGGTIIWCRLGDGKDFVCQFTDVADIVDLLWRTTTPAAVTPLAPGDDLYIIQGGVLKLCNLSDIIALAQPALTSTPFATVSRIASLADAGNVILESTNNSFAQQIVLPKDTGGASDFALNAMIEAVRVGAGDLSFVLADPPNMTMLTPNGAKARAQGSPIYARRRAANAWHITGDTTP